MIPPPPGGDRYLRGSVLTAMLVMMTVLMLAALTDWLRPIAGARHPATEESLAQAREALIGFAASYRDTHADQSFGYLPCPDVDNDGVSILTCGQRLVSSLGHLPWKSLDIPNYRDSSGECLWYAISGRGKNNPKTNELNWDTIGQLLVQDTVGNLKHDAGAHARPLAVVIAPGEPLPGQKSRTPSPGNPCPTLARLDEHLEGVDSRWLSTTHTGDIAITIGDGGTANDRAVWLNASDIFDRIKQRKDFKADIETMMDDLAAHLERLPPEQMPQASSTQKGIAPLIESYLSTNPTAAKNNLLQHWRDNLLYAANRSPAAYALELDGQPRTCRALLFFAGERTAGQRRSTADERDDWRMYLEGNNASTFPHPGKYSGTHTFRPEYASADIVRCIGR